MKNRNLLKTLCTLAVLVLMLLVTAQAQEKETKPRPSLKAQVMQRIGIDTDITIDYSRPGVKGRKIWGELVPLGMEEGNKYSDNKPYPWRGGANESTTITVTKDVVIGGNTLPAGKYTLHFIPSEKDWTIIFNKKTDTWGSYKYNEAEDAFRITVTPVAAPHQEWLVYGFDELNGTECTAYLHWELLKVPFKIQCAK